MKSRNGGRIVAARAAYNSLPEYPTSQTLADDKPDRSNKTVTYLSPGCQDPHVGAYHQGSYSSRTKS